MPAYLNTLRDEILTLIGATWTEVKANGIYRVQDAARFDFDGKAQAGELPFAVLDVLPRPSDRFGLGSRVDEVAVRIHYVEDDSLTPDGLVTKLEAMRTALWPAAGAEALENGQVLEYPTVIDSPATDVMQYFLRTSKPYVSGHVLCVVVAGEQP